MEITRICLMISCEGFVYFRLKRASNSTTSYSDSELEDVAFPLETSIGHSSTVFRSDSCLEVEN